MIKVASLHCCHFGNCHWMTLWFEDPPLTHPPSPCPSLQQQLSVVTRKVWIEGVEGRKKQRSTLDWWKITLITDRMRTASGDDIFVVVVAIVGQSHGTLKHFFNKFFYRFLAVPVVCKMFGENEVPFWKLWKINNAAEVFENLWLLTAHLTVKLMILSLTQFEDNWVDSLIFWLLIIMCKLWSSWNGNTLTP